MRVKRVLGSQQSREYCWCNFYCRFFGIKFLKVCVLLVKVFAKTTHCCQGLLQSNGNKLMWTFYGYVLNLSFCKFVVIWPTSVQEQHCVPALEHCMLGFGFRTWMGCKLLYNIWLVWILLFTSVLWFSMIHNADNGRC